MTIAVGMVHPGYVLTGFQGSEITELNPGQRMVEPSVKGVLEAMDAITMETTGSFLHGNYGEGVKSISWWTNRARLIYQIMHFLEDDDDHHKRCAYVNELFYNIKAESQFHWNIPIGMILAKCSIRLNCLMSLIFYMTSFSRHTLNGSFSWVITRSLLRGSAI